MSHLSRNQAILYSTCIVRKAGIEAPDIFQGWTSFSFLNLRLVTFTTVQTHGLSSNKLSTSLKYAILQGLTKYSALQSIRSPKANPTSNMMYVVCFAVSMSWCSSWSSDCTAWWQDFQREQSAELPAKSSSEKVENWPLVGMSPDKLLYDTSNLERKFSFVSDDGMLPLRSLWAKFRTSKLDTPDNS